MKGIILAGGAGSRLYPLTLVASKQLQPVYDKPMIYYPLTTLMEAGIREFCLISTPEDLPRFQRLFRNSSDWGISIDFREQEKPDGIAQAFLIAESFIDKDPVTLILGDNIFCGASVFQRAFQKFSGGATIFGCKVRDPERYGVICFGANGQPTSLEEKPLQPKSNFVVPGLYIYDNQVVRIAKSLRPSSRGELEITDVNIAYMEMGQLHVCKVNRGFAWLDAGTGRSLYKASSYIRTAEKRLGKKIGCPEEMAFRRGLIDAQQFAALISKMPHSDYREYLERSTVNAGSRSNRRNPSKATISTTSCSSRFQPRVRKPLKKNRSPILA